MTRVLRYPRLRRWARLSVFVSLLIGAMLLGAHLFVHSKRGEEFLAHQLAKGISSLIPGELLIEDLEFRSYFEVGLRGARLLDLEGRIVVEGDSLIVAIEPSRLMRGELSIPFAHLDGGKLWLYEGEDGLPSFLSALITESDEGEAGLRTTVPSIAIRDVSVEGSLGGIDGIALRSVNLDASIHDHEAFLLEISSIGGIVTGPLESALTIHSGRAVVSGDSALGSQIELEVGDESRSLVALELHSSEVGGDEHLELRARILDLPLELFAALGLIPQELFEGSLRGEISLTGPPSSLELSGSVAHEAGTLELRGTIDDPVTLGIKSDRIEAAKLLADLPDITTALDIELELPNDGAPRVKASIGEFGLGDLRIPATQTELTLTDEHIVVEKSVATLRHGHIEGRGTIDFGGKLDLRVDADLPSTQAFAELGLPLEGAVAGSSISLHLHGDANDPELDTTAIIAPLVYGPVYVRRLSLSGRIDRLLEDPNLRIGLRAQGIRIFDEPMADLRLTLRGAGGSYHASGEVLDGSGGIAEGRFDLGREFRLHHATLSGGEFRLNARGVRVAPLKTTIDFLRIEHGEGLLDIRGTLSEVEPGELQANLSNITLADIRQFVELPFPALDGFISVDARIEGALRENPQILAQGALFDVSGGGLDGAIATFFYRHDQGQSLGQSQVDLGEKGLGELGLSAYIDLTERDVEKMLSEAYLDVFLNVHGFDFSLLHQTLDPHLPEELRGIEAHLDADIELVGMLDALDLRASISSEAIRIPGQPTLGAKLTIENQYGSFVSRLSLNDDRGELGYIEGSTLGNQLSLLRDPSTAFEYLNYAPWTLSVQLNERPIADYPSLWKEIVPETFHEIAATFRLEAKGGVLEPVIEGNGMLSLPPSSELDCKIPQHASLPFRFSIRDGEGALDGEFLLGTRAYGELHARAPLPLGLILETGDVDAVPIDASIVLRRLRAETLPFLCEQLTGVIDAEIRAHDLMGAAPRAEALFHSGALRIRSSRISGRGGGAESAPLSVAGTVKIDQAGSDVDLIVRAARTDRLRAQGRTPLRLIPRGLAEFPEHEELHLSVALEHAPLAVPLAFTNALSSVEGYADGWGVLRGTLQAPTYHAELSIDEARFTIASLGQRLSEVSGVASLSPGLLELRHLEAKDGRGRVQLYGELSLDGFEPDHASLHIDLAEFPIRNEGSVVASISGRGEVRAELDANRADAKMELHDIEVSMPSLSGPSVQELSAHPEIVIVGREGEEIEDGEGYDLTLRMDATRGFEVEGPDFSASLTAELIVDLIREELRIGGTVTLEEGRFAVLGKPFEILSGGLRFDREDETLSPTILVEAIYYLDSRRDKHVSVSIAGTLSDPSVRFASNVPTESEGEIISLIITGDTRGAGDGMGQDAAAAGRDAADFVAGIAFGVVSLSLREEFGGFLPMITLEGQNRFRARFDAEQFLPDRVRRIIQRARIEGYFTAGQENERGHVRQSGQAQDIGFSIELGFPRGIVGRGTISPPNRWAADLVWEP